MSSFADNQMTGTVFNIQKYSVHDGPGIRTIVFLKGCPLRCEWCSNPESQQAHLELAVNLGRCIGMSKCAHCASACPHGAISVMDGDKPQLDRTLCQDCPQLCAKACPAKGIITYGEITTVNQVITSVEQDGLFYSRSEGGMTLSGGEPLMQADFALTLLREARRRRISCAIETCGMVPYDVLAEACSHLHMIMFDIKTLQEKAHKEKTGAPLAPILQNFERMATDFPQLPITVRTPVVPGLNATVKDITAIAAYAKRFPNVSYEALPYHRLGTQKYTFLGRTSPMGDVALDDAVFANINCALQKKEEK